MMMKKIIINFLLIITTALSVLAHSGKAKYHAIIEMDNSPSSMNALTLALANTEIEILAVLTNSIESEKDISEMLKSFFHDGIPVYESSTKEKAIKNLTEIFNNEPDSSIYLGFCGLAKLSAIMEFEKGQFLLSQIIVFENDKNLKSKEIKPILEFLSNNKIPLNLIEGQVLVNNWRNSLKYNLYADEIEKQYKKNQNKIVLEKELVSCFLKENSAFKLQVSNETNNQYVFDSEKQSPDELLNNTLTQDFSKENKVFATFPQDKGVFAEDVQQIMDETMFMHGYSEWRACVITNELHGHLGIYAVVGAKMGIRAREYFRIGVDDIEITTYAGTTPPFSCLNDGLQVGTGGTLGHGLIEVDTTVKTKPAATFQFKNNSVYMELKPEYWDQVKKDIKYGVVTFGMDTEKYWAYVRKLALKYWHDWDRHHIFIIN